MIQFRHYYPFCEESRVDAREKMIMHLFANIIIQMYDDVLYIPTKNYHARCPKKHTNLVGSSTKNLALKAMCPCKSHASRGICRKHVIFPMLSRDSGDELSCEYGAEYWMTSHAI